MGLFQAAKSTVQGPIWAELQTHPRFYGWHCCLQNEKKKNQTKGIDWSQHYSLIFQMLKGS